MSDQPRVAPAHPPYRALLHTQEPTPLFLDVLDQQLGGWLDEKGVPTAIDQLSDWGDDARSVRLRRWPGDGTTRYLRLQMVEGREANGTWTTDVLASSEGWVSVDVTNDQGAFVAVPRLVRYLMELIPLGDGQVRFVDEVAVVGSPEVPALVLSLEHEGRHSPTYVIGSDERLWDLKTQFIDWAHQWAKETTGIGRFMLLDPEGTRRFTEIAGSHAVEPWTLRTFLPLPVFDDPIDARRHRWLSTPSLADMNPRAIARLLGDGARALANHATEAAEVRKARSSFDHFTQAELISSVAVPAVRASPEEARPEDVSERLQLMGRAEAIVKRLVGLPELSDDSVAALERLERERQESLAALGLQMKHLQERIDQLVEEQAHTRWLLDGDELDVAEQQQQLEERDAEVAWLRAELSRAGSFDVAHAAAPRPELDAPESFKELLARLQAGRAPGVAFTGDEGVALSLDDHDTLQVAVRTAWEAVLALSDYIRCRNDGKHDAGVKQFLERAPDGYARLSPKKLAPTETAMTMQRFGSTRLFRVPASVEPAGVVTMTAHFKLARIGMVSPRLYFHDDYHNTKAVYVGYLGPHLPNTQTN